MTEIVIQADSRGLIVFQEALTLAQKQRQLAPLERRLRLALSRAFRAQSAVFLNRLRSLRYLYEAAGEEDWGPEFDVAAHETRERFAVPLAQAAEQALLLGAAQAITELAPSPSAPAGRRVPPPRPPSGAPPIPPPAPPAAIEIGFDVTNPQVADYLRRVGADRVTGINDTTRAELRKILSRAADEGWGYTRTSREIRTQYAEFARPPLRGGLQRLRSRAELIAVTEVGDAYEHATMLVAEDLARRGQPVEKSWLAPANPCPVCAPNPSAGWIRLDQAFPSGHQRPTAHPSCRCSLRTRVRPA